MDAIEIYEELTVIFKEVFDEDDIELTPNLTAHDIGGWDSLTHIRLVVSVEKEFSVNFTAAEVGSLKNVGEFVTLIQLKLLK